jgi:hypothetical protein
MRMATAIARWRRNRGPAPRKFRPMDAPWFALPMRRFDQYRYLAWWELGWWREGILTIEDAINRAFSIVGLWDVANGATFVTGRWRWDFWNTIAEHCAEFYRLEFVKERAAHDRTFSQLEASRAYNGKLNLALVEVQEGVRQLRHELELARAVDTLLKLNGDGGA